METFQQFYTDNRDKLFGYLLRRTGSVSLAADLVQESFTRYLERYRDVAKSSALLFTIGRNLFYDQMRRNRDVTVEDLEIMDVTADQEARYFADEQARRLQQGMNQLDEVDRDILLLVVNSGLSYRDIAEIHSCSEANIKVKVHRTRKKLRKILAEYDNG